MKRVVIDLEMCKVPRGAKRSGYTRKNEIIQIGAVMLDDSFEEISHFNRFVHPEYGKMDTFISNLTGIHADEVWVANPLKSVLAEMMDWIGDEEVMVYAWSDTDFFQLNGEVKLKAIEDERLNAFLNPENWIDYQKVFSTRYSFDRCVGLKEALDLIEVDAMGRAHDGLVDAANTGRLIAKMELNPDLHLSEAYRKACAEETDHLQVSMASLFSNICLA